MRPSRVPIRSGSVLRPGVLAVIALCAAAGSAAQAPPPGARKPVQLALFSPVQLVSESQGVSLVRISLLYSVNRSVRLLDVGPVAVTTGGPSGGIQYTFVSINEGSFTGWQGSAFVGVTRGRFIGVQTGLYNSAQDGRGAQWGGVNRAASWKGMQVGLVNYAQRLEGIQLGLVNIIRQGGMFPVFPLINGGR